VLGKAKAGATRPWLPWRPGAFCCKSDGRMARRDSRTVAAHATNNSTFAPIPTGRIARPRLNHPDRSRAVVCDLFPLDTLNNYGYPVFMEFEWDDTKAADNLRTHGVSFEQAAIAFGDTFAVEWIDDREAYGEERSILVGMCLGHLLTVAYTERSERIRIISARRATKHEQDAYYRQNTP
jgi:uncharacterized protein